MVKIFTQILISVLVGAGVIGAGFAANSNANAGVGTKVDASLLQEIATIIPADFSTAMDVAGSVTADVAGKVSAYLNTQTSLTADATLTILKEGISKVSEAVLSALDTEASLDGSLDVAMQGDASAQANDGGVNVFGNLDTNLWAGLDLGR